jgi:6-phosphogluconolactonase
MADRQFNEYDSPTDLDICLAREVAQALTLAVRERGVASLAVSGGKTPVGMFQQLRQMDLPWDKVAITLVDDRWLPTDHADSNERLVRENLLKYRVEAARFFSLYASTPTPEGGLATIEARLRELPQPLDVVILGMGEDGHTASLFPCAVESQVALSTNNISTVAAINPTTAPYARISLTLAAIARAGAVFLHITGAKKRAIYEQAVHEGKLPVAKVLAAASGTLRVYWAA